VQIPSRAYKNHGQPRRAALRKNFNPPAVRPFAGLTFGPAAGEEMPRKSAAGVRGTKMTDNQPVERRINHNTAIAAMAMKTQSMVRIIT
jgi:hypothetical protein